MRKPLLWCTVAMFLLVACGSPRSPDLSNNQSGAPTAEPAVVEPAPVASTPVAIQVSPDNQMRLDFFRKGGVWSMALPASAGATGTSVLVLSGGADPGGATTITVGDAVYTDSALFDAARAVVILPDADRATWQDFGAGFANGIERDELVAMLVNVSQIPDDRKIDVIAPNAMPASEFLNAIEPMAGVIGGETASSAPKPATATPTTSASAEVTPAATEAAEVTATTTPVAASQVAKLPAPAVPAIPAIVIPKVPAIPALPTIVMPAIPAVPALPDIALTPIIPPLPALPAVDSSDAGPIAATAGITLSGVIDEQVQAGTATAEAIALDIVVAADNAQILSSTLHLKNVKCPNTSMGGLDQTYTRPTPLTDGKFAIKISDQGVIEGELLSPQSAQGTANLFLALAVPGFSDIQCDLGRWKWAATAP